MPRAATPYVFSESAHLPRMRRERERERERDLVRLRFVPGESVKPPTSKMTKIMH